MRKQIVCSDQGRAFLEKHQIWMYRNNLIGELNGCEDGEIVDVVGEDGSFLAVGFLSLISHICVRIISFENIEINEAYFKRKISEAVSKRKEWMGENFSNCRLIYAEADGLPGLIVDRYNDILSVQISCAGMEKIKAELYGWLLQQLDGEAKAIYERNDISVRLKEGLACFKGFRYNPQNLSEQTVICENGLRIGVDVANGQKTGYFLDQKENRMLLRKYAQGKRILDCFCHTGGFGLNGAKGNASAVTCVDVSQTALNQALNNARMNGLEKRMTFVQDDVFAYLDKVEKGRFDIIILDPPAFTKSRRTVDHAYQGYLKINTKGFSLLKTGGILISCSCSRYMEKDNFEKMLNEAAQNAGVKTQLLEKSFAGKDHPVMDGMDETLYLKFYMIKVL